MLLSKSVEQWHFKAISYTRETETEAREVAQQVVWSGDNSICEMSLLKKESEDVDAMSKQGKHST